MQQEPACLHRHLGQTKFLSLQLLFILSHPDKLGKVKSVPGIYELINLAHVNTLLFVTETYKKGFISLGPIRISAVTIDLDGKPQITDEEQGWRPLTQETLNASPLA